MRWPAFVRVGEPESARVPLLIHVPHASTWIPESVLSMTDRYTDELFDSAAERGGIALVNRVSRLVCDPERFPDDANEQMAALGYGRRVHTRLERSPPSGLYQE
jgi:N-formylglutamate deformylase